MRLSFFTFEGFRAPAVAALLLIVTALAGCDPQHIGELEEGVATEADVRARFGEPEKIWLATDLTGNPFPAEAAQPGARTLEYNRQPEGTV
ncbi:MAG: hypothetical protein M3Q12_03705, partial [Pseudomonadota bacterium]|nr:hypothetical protein [Pseudomonadota bacterium]